MRVRTGSAAGHDTYSWDVIDNDSDGYRIVGGRYQTARVRAGNACTTFDDLDATIRHAVISSEGTRRSLFQKARAAEEARDRRTAPVAGNLLCALLAEVAAQHGNLVSTRSALDLAACTEEMAGVLTIPLSCQDVTGGASPSPAPLAKE